MIPIKDNIPTDRFPFVTLGLIVANFVVYFLAVFHGGSIFADPTFTSSSGTARSPTAHPLRAPLRGGPDRSQGACSSCATLPGCDPDVADGLHEALSTRTSIIQILGNMLFLWMFGNTVEDTMGHAKYLEFYFVGGLARSACWSRSPQLDGTDGRRGGGDRRGDRRVRTAVPGRARVRAHDHLLFVTVIEIPVLVMLTVVGEQAMFVLADLITPTGSDGWLAYVAQFGGFAFGLLTIKLLRRGATPCRRRTRCTDAVRFIVFAVARAVRRVGWPR